MLVIGIVASVLLALGLIPPYFELAKRKGRVVGINFFFLAMDSAGAFFSLLSVVVGTMDVMSLVLYAIVLAMEMGIFLSQIVWYVTGGRAVIRKEKEEQEAQMHERQNELAALEKEESREHTSNASGDS